MVLGKTERVIEIINCDDFEIHYSCSLIRYSIMITLAVYLNLGQKLELVFCRILVD